MPVAVKRERRFDLDALASTWQRALDGAYDANAAAAHELSHDELSHRAKALTAERQETMDLLLAVGREAGVRPLPWLSPVPLRPAMLGLDLQVKACLFDLEGVLTDSTTLHSWAWAETFDDFLRRFGDRTGRVVPPFDATREYRDYVEGRPRLEGVQTFLRSRGIRLPLGEPDDPSGINTAHALARRKSEILVRELERRGVTALPGARRYLDAAGRLGIRRAVLSASVRTMPMLELAGLGALVEEIVDADRIWQDELRSRPAPDTLLRVCSRLGVAPHAAVTFTSSPLGVTAGQAAGVDVVGVGTASRADALIQAGAPRIVASLTAMLDPRLTAML